MCCDVRLDGRLADVELRKVLDRLTTSDRRFYLQWLFAGVDGVKTWPLTVTRVTFVV